jgi:AraC-like DNA-binding protein
VIDLLAVALAAQSGEDDGLPAQTRQRALARRIFAFVDSHLGDPGLSPATIADEHHISLRYLHKLFEAEHTTVAAWIRGRRLERCRRDLLDPALADRPVGAVAQRWGLPNSAHFSRAFKAAYGRSPGEFRAEAFRRR